MSTSIPNDSDVDIFVDGLTGLSITEQFWERVKQRNALMAAAQAVAGATGPTGPPGVTGATGPITAIPNNPAALSDVALSPGLARFYPRLSTFLTERHNGLMAERDAALARAEAAEKELSEETRLRQYWRDLCFEHAERALAAEQRLAERDASVTRAIARQAR